MAVYSFILLLIVGSSMASWGPNYGVRSWSPSRARAFECTESGVFCTSCITSVFCTGPGATPIPNKPDCTPEVCIEMGPKQAACGPFVGVDAGNCDCSEIGNSGFLLDPYDSSKYILCVPAEFQYFLSCKDGEEFSTTENKCVEAATTPAPTTTPSPTTTPAATTPEAESPGGVDQVDSSTDSDFCSTEGIGLHSDDPTCQSYTACYSATLPGLLLSCNAGEVFDSSALKCVPECDLAPATFSCPASAAGAIADTADCTIFHVCSNGLLVTPATGIACPDGEFFEATSMTCVADSADAVCPEVNSCFAAYCESCGVECPEFRTETTESTSDDELTGDSTDDSTGDSTGDSTVNSTGDSTGNSTGDSTGDSTGEDDDNTGATTSATSTQAPTTTVPPTTTAPATTTPVATTTPEPTTTVPPTTTAPTTTTPEPTTTLEPTTTVPPTTTAPATTTPEATTASLVPDCSNSAGTYEDTTDCKQFYQCTTNDAGVNEAIQYTCPGPLVFVPTLGFCNLQSQLPTAPGCIAS